MQDKAWVGWALPFNRDDGKLLHVTVYARDCLQFVKFFLSKSGLAVGRDFQQRSLIALQDNDEGETMTQEARNKQLLRGSFFYKGFGPVREQFMKGGVLLLADSDRTVRNEELVILSNLEPGYGQLVDGAAMTNTSIWLTSSGFFYILKFAPIVVVNKKFTTPLFTLKAGSEFGEFHRCRKGMKRKETRRVSKQTKLHYCTY